MELQKHLRIIFIIALAHKTSKEWAQSAQKSIWEVSQVFHRGTIGLSSVNNVVQKNLFALSKATAKIAGVFGVFCALFSIVMAFIPGPGSESPELKLMRTEFNKLTEKVHTIARSLKDMKKLIRVEAKNAAYVRHEHKIHTLSGYLALKTCLEKIDNVNCSDIKE